MITTWFLPVLLAAGLSPVPHAGPAGAGLSPARHADLVAAGFSPAPHADLAAAGFSPAPHADLAAAVDAVLADPILAGATTGVVVADARTGKVLVNRGGGRRLLPASNTKLLTSAAAMAILGPDHRFTTDVRSTGKHTGSQLDGDLYLRGGGDPALTPADLDALAASVAATGLRTVTGALVADDTAFDDQRLGLDWAWHDESFFGAAPVSALSVAPDQDYLAGTVTVVVTPGVSAGQPASVRLEPPATALTVVNQAVTGSGGPAVEVTRRHGTSTLDVTGQVAPGSPVTQSVTVPDPTGLAGQVFRTALERHGVRVKGLDLQRRTPASAQPVAGHAGQRLADLLPTLLKLSDNNMADLLVKAVGKQASGVGSWEAGTAAVAAYLGSLGIDTGTFRQVDGSGLSRRNLVPTLVIAKLLVAARRAPWFPAWLAALPVAGDPAPMIGGTLSNRMRGTPAAGDVRAKTGTLTGVAALSGYVTTTDHEDLVFSAITNNFLAPSANPPLDRIAEALAAYPNPDPTPVAASVPAVSGRECSWVQPSVC